MCIFSVALHINDYFNLTVFSKLRAKLGLKPLEVTTGGSQGMLFSSAPVLIKK